MQVEQAVGRQHGTYRRCSIGLAMILAGIAIQIYRVYQISIDLL